MRRWSWLAAAASVICGSAIAFAEKAKEATEQAAATLPPVAAGRGWLMPKDSSEYGWHIDWLIHVTMFFVVILFVIMCIWIAWAALKHGRDHKADYDHGDGRHSMVVALSLSSLIFFVVDGNLFFHSTKDTYTIYWNFEKAESHPKAVRIQVNARQWAWDARYPGADGEFNTPDDIVMTNDIRVPVNVPVIVQMGAVDVIHSFYLPHLRVKTDAVPGTINRFWFQAKETGRFEIACAQHCGVAHYKMFGLLTVLPEKEYAQWASFAAANSAEAYDPEDPGSHWGWPWNRGGRIRGEK